MLAAVFHTPRVPRCVAPLNTGLTAHLVLLLLLLLLLPCLRLLTAYPLDLLRSAFRHLLLLQSLATLVFPRLLLATKGFLLCHRTVDRWWHRVRLSYGAPHGCGGRRGSDACRRPPCRTRWHRCARRSTRAGAGSRWWWCVRPRLPPGYVFRRGRRRRQRAGAARRAWHGGRIGVPPGMSPDGCRHHSHCSGRGTGAHAQAHCTQARAGILRSAGRHHGPRGDAVGRPARGNPPCDQARRRRLDLEVAADRVEPLRAFPGDVHDLCAGSTEVAAINGDDRIRDVDVLVPRDVDVADVDHRRVVDDLVVDDAGPAPAAPVGDADRPGPSPPRDDGLAVAERHPPDVRAPTTPTVLV